MKVKELIELLKKEDSELDVLVDTKSFDMMPYEDFTKDNYEIIEFTDVETFAKNKTFVIKLRA